MKGMELLGLKAQDKVTGLKGVVTCISYDLYGCIQAIITPVVNNKNEKKDGGWFDIKRLKVLTEKPVLEVPDFDDEIGGEDKPLR